MRIPTTMAAVLCLCLCPAPTRAAAPKKPKVVVLAIRPVDESSAKAAVSLTEILTTDLAKTGRFEVMGESELSSLVGFEQKKQLLGCNDASCLAEIGGALGCDFLLMGTMGRVGSKLRLDLKLADVAKTRIAARDGETVGNADELIDAGRRSLRGVLAALDGKPVTSGGLGGTAGEVGASSKAGPYVLVGLGGAALVAGAALAGITVGTKADNPYSQNELRLGAGFVTGGVGAAALLAGIIWAVAAPSGTPPAAVGLAPTPGGAAVCAAGTF